MNLPRHMRSQGGGETAPTPNWNATNDKNNNNKALCFFQFLQAFLGVTVYVYTRLILTTR